VKLKPFLLSFATLAVAAGAVFPLSAQFDATATPLPTFIPPTVVPPDVQPTWIPANGGELPTLIPVRGESSTELLPTIVPPDNVICLVQPVAENVPVYSAPDAASPLLGVLTPEAVYTVFSRVDGWLGTYFGPQGMGWIDETQVIALNPCADVPLPTPTIIGGDPQFPDGTPTPFPMATEIFTATPVPFSPVDPFPATAVPPAAPLNLCLALVMSMDGQAMFKGPGETYAANGFMPSGQYLVLTRSDNGWSELVLLGQQPRLLGWANEATLTLQGNCERLPMIDSADYDVNVWYPDF
jgi:hypothetical protein